MGRTLSLVAVALATFTGAHAAWSEGAGDQPALIRAMDSANVSLQQGLTVSGREGQPISGKFEIEDGKLQLSVYTTKDGKYFEVIVDHTTGKIAKVEAITQGEDLDHAKSHAAAMAKAKVQLQAAVDRAVKQAPGSRAVSVTAEDQSTAAIQLLEGGLLHNVTAQLD